MVGARVLLLAVAASTAQPTSSLLNFIPQTALPVSNTFSHVQRTRFELLVGQPEERRTRFALGGACLSLENNKKSSTRISDGVLEVKGRQILDGISPHAFLESNEGGSFVGFQIANDVSTAVEPLGKLCCSRLLACSRQKLWWMVPSWPEASSLPVETQFLLTELPPSKTKATEYAFILPLVHNNFRSTLRSAPHSLKPRIDIVIESGCDLTTASSFTSALWVAAGPDPFALIEAGFRYASQRLATFQPRTAKALPSTIEDFGYCTWNAFYSGVTADRISSALASLHRAGARPQWLIIDDGWQDTSVPRAIQPAQKSNVPKPSPSLSADDVSNALEASRRASLASFAQAVMAPVTKRVEAWYHAHVEFAPPLSPVETVWKSLATTIFKPALLAKFAEDDDFVQRLESPFASPRFLGAPDTTLRSVISRLKSDYGLQSVFVWHTLAGYWSGIHQWAAGTAENVPKPVVRMPYISPGLAMVEPSMQWNPLTLNGVGVPPPSQANLLYDAMHTYLARSGVDGVKVDAQSLLATLGNGWGGGPQTARSFVHAMEASVGERFGGRSEMFGGEVRKSSGCINCMCHASDCLFSYQSTNLARASDDFYPSDPASHTLHIANVAYNSLFLGEIAQPDWDMFQTRHPAAFLHAAARAVGGSPVYVSDEPGQHDARILDSLVLPDGGILRCELPGRPTKDCLFADVTSDQRTPLKVWNRNACNAIVAAFNLQGARWDLRTRQAIVTERKLPTVKVRIGPSDVPGLQQPFDRSGQTRGQRPADQPSGHNPLGVKGQWVLYGGVWGAGGEPKGASMQVVGEEGYWEGKLEPKDSAVVRLAPIHSLVLSNGRTVRWAAIGLWKMLNAGGAIVSEEQREIARRDGVGAVAVVTVRGEGELMVYCSQKPDEVVVNDESCPWRWSDADAAVFVSYAAKGGSKGKASVELRFA